MKIYYAVLCIMLSVCACNIDKKPHNESSRIITTNNAPSITKTAIVVLGTTQDAGSPQIACKSSVVPVYLTTLITKDMLYP